MPTKTDKRQVNVNGRKLTCAKCKQVITKGMALKVRQADAVLIKDPKDPKRKS